MLLVGRLSPNAAVAVLRLVCIRKGCARKIVGHASRSSSSNCGKGMGAEEEKKKFSLPPNKKEKRKQASNWTRCSQVLCNCASTVLFTFFFFAVLFNVFVLLVWLSLKRMLLFFVSRSFFVEGWCPQIFGFRGPCC